MSPPESSTDSTEPSTDSTASTENATFLSGIEFLTGDDPNLGSFLLTIGAVTCVFIALFQLGPVEPPVSHLLTAGVLIITVVSAGFAALLDSLGYFETTPEQPDETAPPTDTELPWVPSAPVSASLPPMLNFDAELQALHTHYDGDFPQQFDPFIAEYKRLKTNPGNRSSIASDLRADLNPIGTILDEESSAYDNYERISEGLFRYLGDAADHFTATDPVFYNSNGVEHDVVDINDELGRAEVTIDNDGEAIDIDLEIEFYDGDTLLSSRSCPVGTVASGEEKMVDTDVFVPAAADRAMTVITPAAGS
jgi:hypothetical protein